jgi:peptidoglycan/LPS O-acetylase OafA/YrhL
VPGPQAVEVLCLVAVVLATATLSYNLIEKPGRSLLRRVFAFQARFEAVGFGRWWFLAAVAGPIFL